MDRPQSGKMVMDDLEAQRGSQWLSKLKSTLLANEKREERKWDFCILKVPEYLRQPSEEFTPVAWRFGLHNRESFHTSGSEAVKISFANAFGLVGEEFDRFCEFVVDDPKSMVQCYGLEVGESRWTDEVIQKLLALDALFLTLYLDLQHSTQCRLWTSKEKDSFGGDVVNLSRYSTYAQITSNDLCKYENQIPFRFIERAYKYLRTSALESVNEDPVSHEDNEANLYRQWEMESAAGAVKVGTDAFMNHHFDVDHSELTSTNHILGLAYDAICGRKGMQRTCDDSQKVYIHIPSATQLKLSGIKINPLPASKGTLDNMSFESSCLSLPVMNMEDCTISFIRNMAKYEELLRRCMFHDYILIMIDLIKTPMDLELLTNCGVLVNENSNTAFNNWMSVGNFVMLQPSSSFHNDMKSAINRRCKFKRYKQWNEFRKQFCSRPWLVLSAFTIVLVTVATLIQTYTAIIGTDRMKPQFPP